MRRSHDQYRVLRDGDRMLQRDGSNAWNTAQDQALEALPGRRKNSTKWRSVRDETTRLAIALGTVLTSTARGMPVTQLGAESAAPAQKARFVFGGRKISSTREPHLCEGDRCVGKLHHSGAFCVREHLAAPVIFMPMNGSSTAEERAINILRELHAAEEELVGRVVVMTDGKAGAIEHIYLDDVHGLRISIRGHDGQWPISTVKFIQS